MNNTYKIIYKLKLNLKTALHIGVGEISPTGAGNIFKNGLGEFVIPGTSIAGLFFDTLENIYGETIKTDKLYRKLTLRNIDDSKKNDFEASFLIFRSAILQPNEDGIVKKVRDRVKINSKVKSAEDGAKFSNWEITPDNLNPIELEIELDNISKSYKEKLSLTNKEVEKIDKWVYDVSGSWEKEGITFGGFCSNGNGWAELIDAQCCKITTFEQYKNYLDDKLDFVKMETTEAAKLYDTYKVEIVIDDEPEQYGTNSLLIKGGDSHTSIVGNLADGIFINTGSKIFIPGSSLKGALNFFMKKYFREIYNEWEDFTGQNKENAGNLLIEDLYPDNNFKRENLILIEMHSECEFTRAVINKFNEERAFYTTFSGKIRIRKNLKLYKEAPQKIKDIDFISYIKQGCENGLISLGSGGCYPKIVIKKEEV
ncbi:MAG TPA: RAMP superfamily CRISPR-associated protein [Spirochaetota bacterium]|jgi:CRISPR/Cas system CSM-associated protein Csm3 (group 7 of RAMP superfamily)|nr:MAG: RAMP superfamily protein [Spirochaetes bacterium ADurb.Bin133]HNZ26288.1 RAMP superfamily CRISPR-associated protein [Spirochaetota bacterium]HPY87543.1 RAMP superfamily CRISPR-associated protein [Spirochaetota bacterium]